jgi:serine protease Do
MFQDIYLRYRSGCMGLYFMDDLNQLVFLGTTFVVHPDGYLLTAAHAIAPAVTMQKELMVVSVPPEEDFLPMISSSFRAVPVNIAQIDKEHDIALLEFTDDVGINMPDHIIGVPDAIPTGTGVACLGFPFGFQCIYNQVLQQAVVSGKILSANGTRLFLFDSRVQDGSRGAPLISMEDQRVLGIVSGRFDSFEASPVEEKDRGMPTSFSYAVSIEYAVPLMEAQGLEVV